jgi:hypothetical protein
MKPAYPTLRIRMPFARGRAVLYEDYMALENLHSFGMVSEDSRAFYDEVRWVLRYQRRDWYRLIHAVAWSFPLLVGVPLLILPENVIARTIGLTLTLVAGLGLLWSGYRFIAVPRTVAAILSPRGTVEIGTDWPRSRNPKKDAGTFFDTFLAKLELVAEIPAPAPPRGEAVKAPVEAATAPVPPVEAAPAPPPPPPAMESNPPLGGGTPVA